MVTTFRTKEGETILAESGPLPPGVEPTPVERLQQHHGEQATALVILPFINAKQAEQFATLVMAQFGADNFQTPIVTSGTAYEYIDPTTNEAGQVFELFPEARWDAFIKEGNENHHVLQRTIQGGTDDAKRTE